MNKPGKGLRLYIGIALIFAFGNLPGQGLHGTVKDSKTHEPLPFANVFVNSTTIGTTTDEKGNFELPTLPPGFAAIVVSFVGYKTQTINVVPKTGERLEIKVELAEDKSELNEIQISAKKDKEWAKNLKRFKKEFLGTTQNAKRSKILNPWVLEFIDADKMFIAQANEPLKIENLGLGYSLSFFITRFEFSKDHYIILGSAKFSELKPVNEEQRLVWTQNRTNAYYGAEQHLFRSMIEGKLRKEGFELYVESKRDKEIVRGSSFYGELGKTVIPFTFSMMSGKSDIYKVVLPGRIEVHYIKDVNHTFYRDIPYRVFWIEPSQLIIEVNAKGALLNPTSILTTGYTRILRVADMLPSDFEPKEFTPPNN